MPNVDSSWFNLSQDLQTLTIRGCPVHVVHACLAQKILPRLERLTLDMDEDVNGHVPLPFSGLTNLRELCFGNSSKNFAAEALVQLRHLHRLEEIYFGLGQVGDGFLAHLAQLENLKEIEFLENSEITDTGLSHLSELHRLERLCFFVCDNIGDAGLAHLAKLYNLRCLDLEGCPLVTDAGVAHLANLKNLEELSLGGRRITDAGLSHLSGLYKLQHLNLGCCDRITDSGLLHLAGLHLLRDLDLEYCHRVSDEGVARAGLLRDNLYIDYGDSDARLVEFEESSSGDDSISISAVENEQDEEDE